MTTKILNYELTSPPPSLHGLEQYDRLRVHLLVQGQVVGKLNLRLGYRPLSQSVLLAEISRHCLAEILSSTALTAAQITEALLNGTGLELTPSKAALSSSVAPFAPFNPTISIVIPTRDRPQDLQNCLTALSNLAASYPFEIVVSDNNPDSELTEPVARQFKVKYVSERRAGASYARNAGLACTSGEIIVFTDDDVVVTPTWLDNLVAPLADPSVMCVCGLVLPLELETRSQELFEEYGDGGLDRGFQQRRLGTEFFNMWRGAVQTWQLGATANCAVRAIAFTDPAIGPFDETLGPGTAAGVGEDTYLYYRILKAGHICVYEPKAVVYHRHRRDMTALRRQLFSYSKGAVAQQLRIWRTDKDRRALVQIVKMLPQWQFKRLLKKLLGWDSFPLNIILLEIWGNILGVPGFVRSARLIKKQGRITAQAIAEGRQSAEFLLAMDNIKKSQRDQVSFNNSSGWSMVIPDPE